MAIQKIVIIGGCGHIGLPLGSVLADHGYEVSLYDIAKEKVASVNEGKFPFMEEGGEEVLRRVIKTGKLKATASPECISAAEVVILTVGTPVDEYLNPRIQDVMEVIESLIPHFRKGQTVVLRSTLFPGTSELVDDFFKKKGTGVSVAFCPERIAQGKAMHELSALPQIVSSFDEHGARVATEVFGKITGGKTIQVKPVEAELAKLFCNTWRYINFAISNQFFQIAHAAGADFQKVHEAATYDYPRMKAFATAGFAAGPCLFKDTMQLAAFSHNTFFLGHSAMLINEGMPLFTVDMLKNHMKSDLKNKRVAILGMTFKRDNDDIRDSLAFKLRKVLATQGAEVVCHDPFLKQKDFTDITLVSLEEALASDGIVIGTPHSVYDKLKIPAQKPVVDIWGVL